MFRNNNKSAFDNSDFVTKAVLDLLKNGCIEEFKIKPTVVNPLTVSIQKSDKKRLILDLREVNKRVMKQNIKLEDWKIALQYFYKDCYLYKYDLKSDNYHLDINDKFKTYLGFCWNEKYSVFSVLPFGLTSAPYVFTETLRPLVKYWRKHLIRMVLYSDDGWDTNFNLSSCSADASFVLYTSNKAGFVVNTEKSIWTPCKSLLWLGSLWNSAEHSIKVPDERVNDLIDSINSVFSSLPFVSARSLAKVTGRIVSLSTVIGNIFRLMTRNLNRMIESRQSWDSKFCLSDQDVISELNFWKQNVRRI